MAPGDKPLVRNMRPVFWGASWEIRRVGIAMVDQPLPVEC